MSKGFTAAHVRKLFREHKQPLKQRIAELEEENQRLKAIIKRITTQVNGSSSVARRVNVIRDILREAALEQTNEQARYEFLTEYWNTYNTQVEWEDYSDETLTKIVPVEPTIEIANAMAAELPELSDTAGAFILAKAMYRAGIKAAPAPDELAKVRDEWNFVEKQLYGPDITAPDDELARLRTGIAHALYEADHLDDAIMYAREYLGVMSEDEYVQNLVRLREKE